MNKAANILFVFSAALILLSACNDNDSSASPYDEILEHSPFKSLTDSIRLEPQNDDLYFRRAVLLNSNNFPEPALLDFEKAWSLKKNEEYALGVSTLLLEKKPDSAVLFLNDAVKLLPNSLLLQLNLAHAYDQLQKTDEALAICETILQQHPKQVDVMKMKADLFIKKGKNNEATAILQNAYALTPFDVELNYQLALQLAETKNPKVLALCDSLIKADSAEAHAYPYYYKGIYYANTGENAKALAQFDEAIKTEYNFIDAYTEKGSLLYEMKKYNEALNVLNLSLNIKADNANNFYWIARCQEALGNKAEARLNYLRAWELDKTFTEAKQAAEKIINEK